MRWWGIKFKEPKGASIEGIEGKSLDDLVPHWSQFLEKNKGIDQKESTQFFYKTLVSSKVDITNYEHGGNLTSMSFRTKEFLDDCVKVYQREDTYQQLLGMVVKENLNKEIFNQMMGYAVAKFVKEQIESKRKKSLDEIKRMPKSELKAKIERDKESPDQKLYADIINAYGVPMLNIINSTSYYALLKLGKG